MPLVRGTVYDSAGNPAGGRIVRAYRRDTGAFLAATRTSSGTVAADANWSDVLLFVPMDGEDNSTTFLDFSPSVKTATVPGSAKLSASPKQSWSATAGLFTSGGGGVRFVDPALSPTGAFSIECYARVTETGNSSILTLGDESAGRLDVYRSSGGQLLGDMFGLGSVGFSASMSLDTFHHIRIDRNGSTISAWLNGASAGSGTNSTYFGGTIGNGGVLLLNRGGGSMQDYRMTGGTSRQVGAYTPPAAAYAMSGRSVTVGQYALDISYTGEVDVVFVDDAAGDTENDLILRTTGV